MATLNPYRRAAWLILKRLEWDVNPQSWVSRKRIKALKNTHGNNKCVILCNGPSLLKVDFEKLQASNVFTFGLNKINLLFDKEDFRPSVIVAVNPFVIEQNREFYNKTTIPLYLDSVALSKGVKARSNVHYMHSSDFRGQFASDCSISINLGYTVTFVAMQLAYHMGFNQVALVGCDHNFATKGPANKTVVSGETDPNHFDQKYFADGVEWQLPDLFQSEVAYYEAKKTFEEAGRSIVNCTEEGKLELFKRMDLDNFLRL